MLGPHLSKPGRGSQAKDRPPRLTCFFLKQSMPTSQSGTQGPRTLKWAGGHNWDQVQTFGALGRITSIPLVGPLPHA